MKVTAKLFFVALLLFLILSVGAVSAEDNMTFEQSNTQEISQENNIHEDVLNANEIDDDSKLNLGGSHNVGGNKFSNIQNTINSANEGDIIFLGAKNYTGEGNEINVNKNGLTIIGGSNLNDDSYATLDAKELSRIIKISADNVIIKGVKFINGNVDDNTGMQGGAIYSAGKNCQLNECIFKNNHAVLGAAISFDGEYAIIDNCVFIKNSATQTGGAAKLNNKYAVLNNSYFENNSANEDGGAVSWYCEGSFIENSVFIGNSAGNVGGAICSLEEYTNVKNCIFTRNSAKGGGAIYISDNNHIVDNCSFTNNSARENGGAVYWFGNNGALTNSNFTNNSAKYGGAFYSYSSPVTIIRNNFTSSFAEIWGDVIFIGGKNSIIRDNYINNSNSQKSSIYLVNQENTIENNNFTNPELGIEGDNLIIQVKESFTGFFNTSIQIPVEVYELNGKPGTGSVILSGYGAQELIDGKTVFTISLPNATCVLSFNLTKGIKSKSFEVIVVDCSILNITQLDSGDDNVLVRVIDGATGIVMITINGKNYAEKVVNSSALIKIDDLINGNYSVTVLYSGDLNCPGGEKTVNISIKCNPVYGISSNRDITVAYSGSASYKVLITKDGNVAVNENVVLSFNGINTNIKTDSKGYATLKLNTNLKPGTYNVKATCNGVVVVNKVKINPIIKASDKKVKKSSKVTKVKISLKKVDGKYLKSKTLKVKFNGKTYKIKTNKKGVATWKVKKSMLKKIKAGKKVKYIITYGKDTLTKKLIVKK